MVYRPQTHLETRGIVLATTPVRDADLIVTLLSPELGKVAAVARAARGSKKRFLGGFDLFDAGTFKLSRSSTQEGLFTLSGVTEREPWPALRQDLSKFTDALLCLEIAGGLSPDGDASTGELFSPLFKSLRHINRAARPQEARAIAVYFALLTLQISGFNLLDSADAAQSHAPSFQWFEAMMNQRQVVVPHDDALLEQGTAAVCNFIEQILGRRLRARQSLE